MATNRKTSKLLAALVLVGALGGGLAAKAQSAAPAAAPALAPAATVPAAAPDATTTPPAAPTMATPAATPDASATPAATPPAAPTDDSGVTTATVGNPYGLSALWAGGDLVARGTLVILVIMSMGSWYVLVTKAIVQFKIFGQAKQVNTTFWEAGSVGAAVEHMAPGTAFHFVAQSGLEALDQHTGLLDKIDIHSFSASAIDDAVITVQSKMQDGLALLGTVGSTAPFVGLFGTVWGIYHALTAIGIAGQASIDKVAGPVGEALIMTAIGLAVAVPAVLGYNFLVRRNKRAMELVRKFAKKLLFVLLSADAGPSTVVRSAVAGDIPAPRSATVRA
jgi:biopolymer transport protein ExbB